MNSSDAQSYCQALPNASLSYPFGVDVAVYKVCNKMFALLSQRDGINQINLKCDPDRAQALRDLYPGVLPGYHMNKKHWNTVLLNNEIIDSEIKEMIDHSYQLIVGSLKKADQKVLLMQFGEHRVFKPFL